MKLRYATKTSKAGWQYQLEINTKKKQFKRGYFLFPNADGNMTKKQLDEMVKSLIADGYTQIDRTRRDNYGKERSTNSN